MKKLIILFALFAVCKGASAQIIARQDTRFNFFEFSLGVGVPFINNTAFDNWSETYYHSKRPHNIEATGDFWYVGKKYDGGIQFLSNDGDIYQTFTFYFGRRLTADRSPITSFLNIGFGGFMDNIYDYAPVNYKPTPDEIGQSMYLQYTGTFLSLQSRNYINNLGFNISRNRRVNFKSGFYVNLNYRPWYANWQYGYDTKTEETEYDDNGDPYTQTNTKYTSRTAQGVPALASKFMDAGVFVSITLSTLKRHGYYSR